MENGLVYQRATGSAAIAMTVAPGVQWKLIAVRLHLSAAGGAGNLTATMDSGTGAAYDTVLITEDMTSVTDYQYTPQNPWRFEDDELDFAWANANGRTYGLEVCYKLM